MENQKKCNFNLLACHNYDSRTGTIVGLFNSIQLNENEVLSFDLLTIMNFLNKQYETLTIFYCIYNVEKGANTAKIINKSVFRRKNGVAGSNGRIRQTTIQHLSNAIKSIRISNMKFTEKGDYEVRAYVFWDNEHLDITSKEAKEVDIDTLLTIEDSLASVINIEIF